jgi:hypothetical protein
MEFIKIFIIVQFLFLIIQFIQSFRLESFQYAELAFGSFFIIVYFGIFASLLTLDFIQPEPKLLNNSALIAIIFSIWYYITKKLSNLINSDNNGVIYY